MSIVQKVYTEHIIFIHACISFDMSLLRVLWVVLLLLRMVLVLLVLLVPLLWLGDVALGSHQVSSSSWLILTL